MGTGAGAHEKSKREESGKKRSSKGEGLKSPWPGSRFKRDGPNTSGGEGKEQKKEEGRGVVGPEPAFHLKSPRERTGEETLLRRLEREGGGGGSDEGNIVKRFCWERLLWSEQKKILSGTAMPISWKERDSA